MHQPGDTQNRQMFNPDTGNWITFQGGGEWGMDWQMDDDCRMQGEWDAEMEDIIADTTEPLKVRLQTALRLAKDRQRRAINIARYNVKVTQRTAAIKRGF